MIFSYLLWPGLIWATKRRQPDTESSDNCIPQINPNGIALDYANLPEIQSFVEELISKAKAELSPELAVKLFNNLYSSERKAEMLLQLPEWKPACARLLWLHNMPYFNWNNTLAMDFLNKAIEQGDFQPLKDLIDYSLIYSAVFRQYLEKYGLMHAQHLRQDLRDAFEEWRSYKGQKSDNSLLSSVAATFFSDYSKNHRSMLREFIAPYTRSPVDIKLQFVFLQANFGKEAIMQKISISKQYLNFKNLAMLEKLCLEYAVPDYEAGLQKIGGPMWIILKSKQVDAEILDLAMAEHSWRADLGELGQMSPRWLL